MFKKLLPVTSIIGDTKHIGIPQNIPKGNKAKNNKVLEVNIPDGV